jgi:hypothetical protein
MAWTQTDLDSIERAIASGTTRVRYKDREVQYNSLAELITIRNLIRDSLGSASKNKNQYGTYDNDL